jgi:hypothetical protein
MKKLQVPRFYATIPESVFPIGGSAMALVAMLLMI